MEKPERNGKSWTAEARRQERKKRLASRKGGDGRLHAQGKHRSLKAWLAIVAVIVALLGVLVYAGITNGIPQRA
jgi:ABC-type Fe3+ transport system permease subunit